MITALTSFLMGLKHEESWSTNAPAFIMVLDLIASTTAITFGLVSDWALMIIIIRFVK